MPARGPLRCCSNEPKFRIHYVYGSTYLVCSDCIELDCWFQGIKDVEDLTDGPGQDVINRIRGCLE